MQDFLKAKSLAELKSKNIDVTYSFEEIGNYKRKNWKFQNEWRYKISIAPMGLQESNPPSLKKQQEYFRRLEDRITEPPCQRLFLNMDENAFKKMEVVFGPRMTDAEKIMAVV